MSRILTGTGHEDHTHSTTTSHLQSDEVINLLGYFDASSPTAIP